MTLTQAELMEMEMGVDGGMTEMLQKIIKAKESATLIKVFKDLIIKSYGKKSDDGRRFIKNDELRAEFEQSPLYSDLFMELATNDEAASNFVKGIIPNGTSISDADLAKAKNELGI